MLHTLAAAAIAAAVAFFAGRHFSHTEPEIETRTDTLVVRDTLVAYKPVPVEVRVRDTIFMEVPVPVEDSVLYLPVALEQRVYEDSTYRAVVSGPAIDEYGPSLDTIEVYRRTVYVDRIERVKVEPSRWSWGVQAGVGYGAGGVTPHVGLGIQYRLGYFEIRK